MPPALLNSLIELPSDRVAEPATKMLLEFDDGSLVVNQNRIRIGTSPLCEIRLPSGPLLHSVILYDAGVLWVEADDDAVDLNVNWRTCRRMSLRDGDVVSAAGFDITVRHVPAQTIVEDAARLVHDISHLTAEELCDQILAEQSAVEEFEAGRINGMKMLMSAMRAAVAADRSLTELPEAAIAVESTDGCEGLLSQIREMSEMMSGRTQELDVCESDLVAATALLQETQDRVSRQIQELLDQIGEVSKPVELRASA